MRPVPDPTATLPSLTPALAARLVDEGQALRWNEAIVALCLVQAVLRAWPKGAQRVGIARNPQSKPTGLTLAVVAAPKRRGAPEMRFEPGWEPAILAPANHVLAQAGLTWAELPGEVFTVSLDGGRDAWKAHLTPAISPPLAAWLASDRLGGCLPEASAGQGRQRF